MSRFFANLFWFFSCLPDYFLFRIALRFPRAAQNAVRRRQRSRRGREVLFYEPTSGTTGGTKRIPYTRQLKAEFRRGINPWIASLYLAHPSLFFARHYWSISPSTKPENADEGFATDAEYLGGAQRFLTRALFAVPASVAEISDPRAHQFQTLLHLLADTRLGLISVWHPSFLLILLDAAVTRRDEICDAMRDKKRAAQLRTMLAEGAPGYRKIWPRLRVISCWTEARAAADSATLRELFPRVAIQPKGLLATEGIVTLPWQSLRVAIQPKGLLATEGIVTLPWQSLRVAAVRSHVLTFRYNENGEARGAAIALHEVEAEKFYTVHLTTGNGFADYPLRDLVRCTGFVGRAPCFEFVSRVGLVADLRGEKLYGEHVEAAIRALETETGAAFAFAMLMPNEAGDGYLFCVEAAGERTHDCGELAARLDEKLCANFHYRHARAIGQLRPLAPVPLTNAMSRWRAFREQSGTPQGAVKPPVLLKEHVRF